MKKPRSERFFPQLAEYAQCRQKLFEKNFSALIFGLLCLLVIFHAPASLWAGQPEYEIKLATMAPENSSMMQIFNEMNAEVLKETGGKVGFKLFAGFVLGDEEDVLRKLRIGMVHAAAFTSTALTDVNHDLRALLVPFLFDNYQEVDYIMAKLEPDLKRGFAERGLEVLGWPELGFLYFMSTTPIASLHDLKGKKIWGKSNAPMLQAIMERIGVSTVAINAPDVLMALQTNLLEVVYNSPYYALITQWYTQIKYLTDTPVSYVGGVLVMDKKFLAKIPDPLQETLKKVSARTLQRVVEQTRKDNADALEIIFKRGVKKVTPDPSQIKGFKELSNEAMADLGPKQFPMATYKKIQAELAEYRAQHRGNQ
jgi:TRAP-type C4-dicarboxylate transport system substrate-binding protein